MIIVSTSDPKNDKEKSPATQPTKFVLTSKAIPNKLKTTLLQLLSSILKLRTFLRAPNVEVGPALEP